LTNSAGPPDGRRILAHDGALQHLEARGAEDVEPNPRSHAVDLDQHLEELELFDAREAVKRELVLADMGVYVQVELAARRWKLLSRLRGNSDEVAHAADLEDDEIRTSAAHHAGEMSDHLWIVALANPRLRE
jgi:hypothetical protein